MREGVRALQVWELRQSGQTLLSPKLQRFLKLSLGVNSADSNQLKGFNHAYHCSQ